jgi:nitrous oxide reductase accessory protein NosL
MRNFKNDVPNNKKLHQYLYTRSMAQKSMWERMKEDGWSCRRGRYYRPDQNRKGEGMSCDDAFEWYESIQNWLNG